VRRRFRAEYTLAGLDLLLHRIGWSAQVPARQATERNEAAVPGRARPACGVREQERWRLRLPLLPVSPQPATSRTRPLPVSAISRLPAPSTATPDGPLNSALVAGPLSPENPALPSPATV
jgi:hypothetical protein